MAFTTEDIINAYQQSVGAGTMTEAEFVRLALSNGVPESQLLTARDVLTNPEAVTSIPASVSDSTVSSALPTVSQNLTPEQLQQFTNYLTPETLNQIYGGLADPTLPGGIRANLGYEWDSMEAQVSGGPGRATLTGYSGPIGADDMYNEYSPTGEFLGRYKASDDSLNALLPIALAVGGQFLFGGGLGGAGAAGAAGTTAAGLGPIELAIAAGEGIIPVTAAQTATAGLTAAQLAALGSGIGLTEAALLASLPSLPNTPSVPPVTPPPGTPSIPGLPSLPPGVTDTVTKLLSNPATYASLMQAMTNPSKAGAGGTGMFSGPGSVPTQGLPQYTGNYFDTLQGFLNQYAPGRMPNQSDYLADWYNQSGYSGVPAGMMTGAPLPSGGVAPSFTSVGGGAGPSSGITPIDYTLDDIVNAYKQSVRMGTMTEAEFVAEALRRGVKGRDLNRARDILLAE